LVPSEGWRVHMVALGADVVHRGGVWGVPAASADQLGINAAADATNRLAVGADATLLTHDGAGHQLKLNKANTSETASLLFQTGFSGRAEMGCAGEDAFTVKVSADGAAWTTALRLDPATGEATGAAVQADADDTNGKLARTDWTFGRGNALSPVSLAAGAPTGGLIESGETANGHFVKYADGTMICRHRLTVTQTSATELGADWTFPAAFAAGDVPVIAATAGLGGATLAVTPRHLGALVCDAVDETKATLIQFRIIGSSGTFDAGDSMNVHVTATGRWA
ncbi:MAG: DUF2793 domain-containing protein, partial [Jannaschia sp.]